MFSQPCGSASQVRAAASSPEDNRRRGDLESVREKGNMKRVVEGRTRTTGEDIKMSTISGKREDPTTAEQGIETGRTEEEEDGIEMIKSRRDHTEVVVEREMKKDLGTVDEGGGSGNQKLKEEEEDGIEGDPL